MTDVAARRAARSLQRPERARPSWRRRIGRLGLALVIGLGAAIIGRQTDTAFVATKQDCATLVRKEPADLAVHVCRREYQERGDPKTGARLAFALSKHIDLEEAKQLATSLRVTSARPDALQVLGAIKYEEGRSDEALTDLETARTLHRLVSEPREVARDDAMLALVRSDRSEFTEALQLLDECINLTKLWGDTTQEWHCHTVAARTLIGLGYFSAAKAELKSAEPLVPTEEARINLEYQKANLEQESGHPEMAIAIFERVLRLGEHSRFVSRTIKTEQNLAYSLADRGSLAEAQQHIERANRLDTDNSQGPERAWTAAYIAYRRHDLAQAGVLTDTYFRLLGEDSGVDRDDRIDVATLRARIEIDRNDLESAEEWAQRAVMDAERIRGAQSALELRGMALTKRREPYELLFSVRARRGRTDEAVMVFDAWQARTVQDALARSPHAAQLDRVAIADQLTRLGAWLRVASPARSTGKDNREQVLRTMRNIDLLALIVADGDVWRLTANHGPPRLSRIARKADIQTLIDNFLAHPADVQPAAALGELLLTDDVFRDTADVLYTVIDGALAVLPIIALRRGGRALIDVRPVVRVLRLPETHCIHLARSGHATVLADAAWDLTRAREEGAQVAELLHTKSKIGSAATKAALRSAAGDAVLHVATHASIGMDGAALELADGEVSALAIPALRIAPSLVVLSNCASAASSSDDGELAGSLTAGFLAAGSQHVVATLQSISDDDALDVATRFYRAGGVSDPARALQTVQRELVGTNKTAWPHFAVFGPDVCLPGTPDTP